MNTNGQMIAIADTAISGEMVSFTPLQMSNIYQHFEWNNDPELNRLDNEMPYKEESFGAFKKRFERMVTHPSSNSVDFEIHAKDGTLIGVAYVADISEHNRHCTAGITIGDRDYWGKNYGRDALNLLLDYCFEELGMHRVATETFEYNTAWKKLVEWAGFKQEGVEQEYLFRDGVFWDKEIYGLLERDYRAARGLD